MKIKMKRDTMGTANAAGSKVMLYKKQRTYVMSEDWQKELAAIFVEQMDAADYVTTRDRGRPKGSRNKVQAVVEPPETKPDEPEELKAEDEPVAADVEEAVPAPRSD